MNKVYVIGIGFRPLGEKASYVVNKSDVVLANSRLLEVFKHYREYEAVKDQIITHGTVYEMLDYVADNYQTKKIALLAAGDPMFFGIGRLVVERLGKDAVEVFPDLSSIQVAFSRIREISNNAFFLSLHGGPDPEKRRKLEHELADLPELLEGHNKIAILTDKVNSPEAIAGVIARSEATKQSKVAKIASPPARNDSLQMFVCEKLGYENERIISGAPEEILKMTFEHPNVVIIKSAEAQKRSSAVGARRAVPLHVFGLREDEIQHSKGLITKDEVRAVTIHKLRLPKAGVLWDIGAGSGSVSIEAAGLCPDISLYAVEKSEEQIKHLNANKDKFKTANIEIIHGAAPDALQNLPAPDRVFIGGSGGRLEEIIGVIKKSQELSRGEVTSPLLSYELIVVVNATTIETLNEAVQSLERNDFKVDVSEVSVSRSKIIGGKRHMSALNPVFVIKGERFRTSRNDATNDQ